MLKRAMLLTSGLFIAVANMAVAAAVDSAAKFRIANVIQSNMVVQQNKPLRIWGTAPAGDVIELQADWTGKTTIATADANGKWLGEIKVPGTTRGNFTPHTITIIHKDNQPLIGKFIEPHTIDLNLKKKKNDIVKLTNILIGDVWVASGQSNMEMRMATVPGWGTGVKDFEKELRLANYPAIRLYKEEMGIEFTPQDTIKGEKWEACTPKSAAGFSGVAYYFGRELFNRLQIPIGLVGAAIPATAAQAFTDINILLADTALKKKYVDPYSKAVDSIQA
ncbi:MAG: hypothetical protein EOP54_27350, partial [Sphingobacteriales bacterium]